MARKVQIGCMYKFGHKRRMQHLSLHNSIYVRPVDMSIVCITTPEVYTVLGIAIDNH